MLSPARVQRAAQDARGAAGPRAASCWPPRTRRRCCPPSAAAPSTSSSSCCRPQELEDYVRWIVADAGLDVDDAGRRLGGAPGSGLGPRHALGARPGGGRRGCRHPVRAGGAPARVPGATDTGLAIVAVADALAQGHDPRVLGDAFLDSLRDAFLLSLGVEVPHLVEHDRERPGAGPQQLGTPALTRAMEAVGAALVDMRQAADPRVPLEVALVRLTAAQDTRCAGLAERLERLERAVANGRRRRGRPRRPGPAAAPARTSERPARRRPPPGPRRQPAAAAPAAPAAPAPEVEGGPAAAPDAGARTGDAAGEAAAEPTVSGRRSGPGPRRTGGAAGQAGPQRTVGQVGRGCAAPAAPGPPPARPAAPSRPADAPNPLRPPARRPSPRPGRGSCGGCARGRGRRARSARRRCPGPGHAGAGLR